MAGSPRRAFGPQRLVQRGRLTPALIRSHVSADTPVSRILAFCMRAVASVLDNASRFRHSADWRCRPPGRTRAVATGRSRRRVRRPVRDRGGTPRPPNPTPDNTATTTSASCSSTDSSNRGGGPIPAKALPRKSAPWYNDCAVFLRSNVHPLIEARISGHLCTRWIC